MAANCDADNDEQKRYRQAKQRALQVVLLFGSVLYRRGPSCNSGLTGRSFSGEYSPSEFHTLTGYPRSVSLSSERPKLPIGGDRGGEERDDPEPLRSHSFDVGREIDIVLR